MDKDKKALAGVLAAVILLTAVYVIAFSTAPVKSSSKYVDLHFHDKNIDNSTGLRRLREDSSITVVTIHGARNSDIRSLPVCENVERVQLDYSEMNELYIFEKFPNIKRLRIFSSDTVISRDVKADALEEIDITYGRISGIDRFGSCPDLRKLKIYHAVSDGTEVYEPDDKEMYVLEDSSCFAGLDTVETLTLQGVRIDDFSGFLEMDSLEFLYIDQDNMNQNNQKSIEALKSRGIFVNDE